MAFDQQSDVDSSKKCLIDLASPRWDVVAMTNLKDLFVSAYGKQKEARTIAETAGINLSHWHHDQAIDPAWKELIEIAMAQGKLRALLDKVVNDNQKPAFKPSFKEYLQLEVPQSTGNAALSINPTPSPAAAQPATTPAIAMPPAVATNTTAPSEQSATPPPPTVQPKRPPAAPSPSKATPKGTSTSSPGYLVALLVVLVSGGMVTREWLRFQTASQIKLNPSLSIQDEAGIIKKVLPFKETYLAIDRRDIPAGKTKFCLNVDETGGGRLRFDWTSRPPGRILGSRNDKCCELNLVEDQSQIDVDVKIELEHTSVLPWFKPRVNSAMRTLSVSPLTPSSLPRKNR